MAFFFNDTATTEIYTLSLHGALPICGRARPDRGRRPQRDGQDNAVPDRRGGTGGRRRRGFGGPGRRHRLSPPDRKSTRLNSSHANISYAVFCLKKKKQIRSSKELRSE